MRTVDLFAGCGGMSQGFLNAGFDLVAAYEFWHKAAECYRDNFVHPVFELDLSDTASAIKHIRNFTPDLVIGGPPCQDFSHAGKRVEAERANLTVAYATIVSALKVKYFVMENVDRAQKSDAFRSAREIFKENGYGITEITLDASHCGVPQKRKRFFCIGVLNGVDEELTEYLIEDISEHETTMRDYFGNKLGFEYYYRHPRNYNRRGIFSIDEPAPTMRGVNRPIPKGYPGHPNDACPLSKHVRALTTEERALVQTFPTDFVWHGSKTDKEQMIGNAVPVKLAEFVAAALQRFISKKTGTINYVKANFQHWLINEKNYSVRSASDTVSRVKRADKLYPICGIPDSYYLYQLENTIHFNDLSVSVKSQLKRAMKLYAAYLNANI